MLAFFVSVSYLFLAFTLEGPSDLKDSMIGHIQKAFKLSKAEIVRDFPRIDQENLFE
jgi:hypothetical protein